MEGDLRRRQDFQKNREQAEPPKEVLEATTDKQLSYETQGQGLLQQRVTQKSNFPSRLQDSRLPGLMSWNQAQCVIKAMKKEIIFACQF